MADTSLECLEGGGDQSLFDGKDAGVSLFKRLFGVRSGLGRRPFTRLRFLIVIFSIGTHTLPAYCRVASLT